MMRLAIPKRLAKNSRPVRLLLSGLFLSLLGPGLIRAQDPGAMDTVYLFNAYAGIDDSVGGQVRIEIRIKTDNLAPGDELAGVDLPLVISNSNPAAQPVLDTTVSTTFAGSDFLGFDILQHNGPFDPSVFPLQTVLGTFILSGGLTAGDYLFANLVFSVTETTTFCIDTMTRDEAYPHLVTSLGAGYFSFWQPYCLGVTAYPYQEPPLFLDATGPVNLIVIDPMLDSIGIDFNTLDSAYYDALEDSLAIYSTHPGNYKIKVVRDLLDQSGDSSYAITARIDGTADQVVTEDQPAPDSGEATEITITVDPTLMECLTETGEVNAQAPISLPDVIHLVNYVFDKDRPATGCLGSAPSSCWSFIPSCRGEVNGTPPISLPDVIYLVNYIFDKDRPANSCLGTDPGNCWLPVATGVCCLP